MKVSRTELKLWMNWGGCALTLFLLAGCRNVEPSDPVNPKKPFTFPGQTSSVPATAQSPIAPAPAPTPIGTTPTGPPPLGLGALDATNNTTTMLRTGDPLTVSFSDLPPPGLSDLKTRIGEDGKITLPYNVSVLAAGKTARQLEQDIRAEYVPKYYNHLTANVRTEERFYYVGGEVKQPSRQIYSGSMTVLRAIDTALGFTDFANRKNIELRRSNGQKLTINWFKAIKDSSLDFEVYPNDQVIVHKRGPFQ